MTPRPPLWILYDVFGQSLIGAMSAGLILRVIGKTIAKLARSAVGSVAKLVEKVRRRQDPAS